MNNKYIPGIISGLILVAAVIAAAFYFTGKPGSDAKADSTDEVTVQESETSASDDASVSDTTGEADNTAEEEATEETPAELSEFDQLRADFKEASGIDLPENADAELVERHEETFEQGDSVFAITIKAEESYQDEVIAKCKETYGEPVEAEEEAGFYVWRIEEDGSEVHSELMVYKDRDYGQIGIKFLTNVPNEY